MHTAYVYRGLCTALFSLSLFLCAAPRANAQAPASGDGFTNYVLTLVLGNGSAIASSAARILPNGTVLSSGNVLFVGASFGATNATYSQLALDTGLLTLTSSPGSILPETNYLTMLFATATNGFYTNRILRPNLQPQTNDGTFTLREGTNVPPTMFYQTPSQVVASNGSVALVVSAIGFGNTYQWRHAGTNLPGRTTIAWNLSGIQPEQLGDYTCVAANSAGTLTSAVTRLTYPDPAGFTLQPQSRAVLEGSYVYLSYAATGSLQNAEWWKNGAVAANAMSNAPFVISGAQSTDAGAYFVRLDNFGAFLTSAVATVSVRAAGLETLWRGRHFVKVADEQTLVPAGAGARMANWGNPALTPLLTYRDGKVHVVAGTTAGLRSLFRWQDGTLSTLVGTNTPTPEGPNFGDVFYPTDEGDGTVNFAAGYMYSWSNGVIRTVIGGSTPAPGRGTNVLGGTGSYGRRGSGVAISSTILAEPGSTMSVGTGIYFDNGAALSRIADDQTDLPGAMGGYAFRPTANSVNFDGATVVFSTVESLGGPGGFYRATPAGTITKLADHTDPRPDNPAVTFGGFGDLDVDGGLVFGVANGAVCAFETNGTIEILDQALSVAAAGPRIAYYHDDNFLYCWDNGTRGRVLRSGDVVDGRKVSRILRMDAQGDDVCVLLRFADNSHGIYLVRGAVPTVPVIVSEPADYDALDNTPAPFYVTAVGQAPLAYQWYKDGLPLPQQTNSSLIVANATAAAVGGYHAIVSSPFGTATSRVAQLTRTVPAVPKLISSAALGSMTYSSNLLLTVTAAGDGLVYTWRKSGALLAGATTSALPLNNLGASDPGTYTVGASNVNGGFSSSFNVLVRPIILQQPVSTTNYVGGTAGFTVVADGIAPLTYAWRYGSNNPTTLIQGATNATLTLTNLSLTNSVNFRVAITSGTNGSVSSQIVRLTVLPGGQPKAPQLSAPLLASGQFKFLLPTEPGFKYTVLTSTNLAKPQWEPDQTVNGDGTAKQVTVDAGADHKLVRVRVE